MISHELRARRHASGLTLAEVARSAGTSTSNVSAYELGTKRPNADTFDRMHAVTAVGADSVIHRNDLLTVPAAAARLRRGLRTGWSTADLLRVVRELRFHARYVSSPAEFAAFFAKPSTTGDRRWDAMLAGVSEMDALNGAKEVPGWTAGHHLGHLWFVGSMRSLDAWAFTHTPPSLFVRGVIVDQAEVETVHEPR